MTRVEELIEQVRALPQPERELVVEILAGESENDFELSPEWRHEIQRRVAELNSGTAKTYSYEEVKERLERRLNGRSWD